jgi:DNA-binding transcriptional ArsR family regulator
MFAPHKARVHRHRLDFSNPGFHYTNGFNNQLVCTLTSDRLNSTFAALSDPTRRAILSRLARGEASVSELAEPFDMTLPAISKHLKVLEHAGLIVRERDAQRRPCRLVAAALKDASEWFDQYRRFWDASSEHRQSFTSMGTQHGRQK